MTLTIDKQSTLSSLFADRVKATPHACAYRYFRDGAWRDLTWGDVAHGVAHWRQALTRENFQFGDRVALCLHNRVEWVMFDQAALSLGLVVIPLYYNDRPENIAWCLKDAGVRLLLLEDAAQWGPLHDQAGGVERVLYFNGKDDDPRAMSVESWMPPFDLSVRAALLAPRPEDLATVVYTSGTTGRPKGVMLTHGNIVSNLRMLIDAVPQLVHGKHSFLSFLPLSHMFERTVGYYFPICLGFPVIYARGIQHVSDDLLINKPTLLVSVPRIFERVYTSIDASLPHGSLKRWLFENAISIGWERFNAKISFIKYLQWRVLDLLVARKLRARLGGRLQYIMLGGAALAPHLLRAFTAMGLTFIHGYGLTETSPVLTCNRLDDNDPLSVGKPLKDVETHIAGTGELWVRGPTVTCGYWNNPQATSMVLDDDGWFHTGDVVDIKKDKIYIRGRIKDIIVLSNGEKVPPGDVEQAIMQDPAFEQVMLVGEGRPALGLLVVSAIMDEYELCIRANRQLYIFPGYIKIQHLARVSETWSIENGMLTPTLKLKRNKIEEKYANEIETMYKHRSYCHSTSERNFIMRQAKLTVS